VLHAHGEQSWDETYHRLVFSWAGHVHRIGSYDPDRLTFQVLHYKDWQWIQLIASQNGGNQLHCRELHTWRWERPLYKFCLRVERVPGNNRQKTKPNGNSFCLTWLRGEIYIDKVPIVLNSNCLLPFLFYRICSWGAPQGFLSPFFRPLNCNKVW
jgi:hypothetical protein